MKAEFKLSLHTYATKSNAWSAREVSMPKVSALLNVAGSGAVSVRSSYDLWQESSAANTSRAIFSAFCESLSSGRDSHSGGAPQLVGLYRIGPGRTIGTLHERRRYLSGARLTSYDDAGDVEWRNELFERISGVNSRRIVGSQRHKPRSSEGD